MIGPVVADQRGILARVVGWGVVLPVFYGGLLVGLPALLRRWWKDRGRLGGGLAEYRHQPTVVVATGVGAVIVTAVALLPFVIPVLTAASLIAFVVLAGTVGLLLFSIPTLHALSGIVISVAEILTSDRDDGSPS